jgi:TusA-related sulfurtransferase
VRIDARGLRCPWPALRLARALRDGAELVEILSDDPAAPGELAAVATAAGAEIAPIDNDFAPSFRITKPTAVNRSFTPFG